MNQLKMKYSIIIFGYGKCVHSSYCNSSIHNSKVFSVLPKCKVLIILAGGEQECSEANEDSAEEASPDCERESSLAE